jgi:hypothetical protein
MYWSPHLSRGLYAQVLHLADCFLVGFETLGLIIAARGVKPAVAMKTLFGRFRFIVFGVIAIVAVVSCCNFPIIQDTKLYVELGHKGETKRPTRTYVEWKNKGDFDKALAQVRAHNGKICICVVMPGGTPYPHELNNDCRKYEYDCPPPPENIRTVKVTKSKAADNIAAGGSAVNDPHVTYRVQANLQDISAVLAALSPTPAPSH